MNQPTENPSRRPSSCAFLQNFKKTKKSETQKPTSWAFLKNEFFCIHGTD